LLLQIFGRPVSKKYKDDNATSDIFSLKLTHMKRNFTTRFSFPQSNIQFSIDFRDPLNVIEFLFGNNKFLLNDYFFICLPKEFPPPVRTLHKLLFPFYKQQLLFTNV